MEVFIALFVNDDFVRPYLGDVLVVILLYCFARSFLKIGIKEALLSVLIFAFTIEFFQNCGIVKYLGLEDNRMARVVISTSFSWLDMLCYTAGGGIVFFAERLRKPIAI
jgi:hypothetical protein